MTNIKSVPEQRFPLGVVFVTAAVERTLAPEDIQIALLRHERGDWGDICRADGEANDEALKHGGRLLSAYHDRAGVKFWIITESDRSATTVLLPDDY